MRAAAGLFLVLLAGLPARAHPGAPVEPSSPGRPAPPGHDARGAPPPGESFDELVARLERQRAELAARLRGAGAGAGRRAVLLAARRALEAGLIDGIFPAWRGTPFGLGRDSVAGRPFEAGKTVNCGAFVSAALLNVGFRLESRARFMQAPALWVQQALLPRGGRVHRYSSLDGTRLAARFRALGDGVYLVGLNIHIGFAVVRGDDVRFVHASYTAPREVVAERLASSAAIALSRTAGYTVAPLFRDDRLLLLWLARRVVPAPPRWPPRAGRSRP